MKTLFNDEVVVLNTEAFFQCTTGEKVITGVISKDGTLFFPVFGVQGKNGEAVLVEDGAMTIDPAIHSLTMDTRTVVEVHHEFVSRLLPNPKSVGNQMLYWFFKKQVTAKIA